MLSCSYFTFHSTINRQEAGEDTAGAREEEVEEIGKEAGRAGEANGITDEGHEAEGVVVAKEILALTLCFILINNSVDSV